MKWWLGAGANACPHCSQPLDIHKHHALICRSGGDVVTRRNHLHDCFADFCHRASLAAEQERGCEHTSAKNTRYCNWLLRYLVVREMRHNKLSWQRIAKKLAIKTSHFWPKMLASKYCRLSFLLAKSTSCEIYICLV